MASPPAQPTIGITLGDPSGIGPEVVAKSLKKSSILAQGHFKIIGDSAVFRQYGARTHKNCDFIDLGKTSVEKITYGRPNRHSAAASIAYIRRAIEMLKAKDIVALVTGPVCKEAIADLGVTFSGHTELLAQAFRIKNFDMMFTCSPEGRRHTIRTITVTRHIPLMQVSQAITAKKVYASIKLADNTLKQFFKIKHPQIAVCGLNPHAGEGGNLGKEETLKINPAIRKARSEGLGVNGPFAADTLFSSDTVHRFDVIIAMYHDQGLIPVKTLYFTKLVNLTIGLPFVRTSPAHGTAFDIAGKNEANPSSMIEAIKLAALLSKR